MGDWRICQVEQWDERYIDCDVPAFIRFDKRGKGSFHCGEVYGYLDYRAGMMGDRHRIVFEWRGAEDGDFVKGKGWAEARGGRLSGHFYINRRYDFSFCAQKAELPDVLCDPGE